MCSRGVEPGEGRINQCLALLQQLEPHEARNRFDINFTHRLRDTELSAWHFLADHHSF
jgi:hypothetical protein